MFLCALDTSYVADCFSLIVATIFMTCIRIKSYVADRYILISTTIF